MESEHDDHQPASENPSDGEEQGANQLVSSRSYECNFCKRGFSNAQALGGHMNIHRKDKAKLKQQQSSNQTHPSLDQSKSDEQRNKSNWNWNVSQQEQASSRAIHTRQLPLFAESPTSNETLRKPQGQTTTTTTEQTLLSTQDRPSLELDLELRLGPEPQDSSEETGTRKFF